MPAVGSRPWRTALLNSALGLVAAAVVFLVQVQPAQAWIPIGTLPTLGTARTRLPPVVICPGTCCRGDGLGLGIELFKGGR